MLRQWRNLPAMTVAEEIRALRAVLKEDTETFAARWRRSSRTIENWEQGRREPDAFTLDGIRKLAERRKKSTVRAR
jgi:DNA-binding transcriptional regulator YiaG